MPKIVGKFLSEWCAAKRRDYGQKAFFHDIVHSQQENESIFHATNIHTHTHTCVEEKIISVSCVSCSTPDCLKIEKFVWFSI